MTRGNSLLSAACVPWILVAALGYPRVAIESGESVITLNAEKIEIEPAT